MKTNFKRFLIEQLVSTATKELRTRSGQPVRRVFNNHTAADKQGSFSYVKPDSTDPHMVNKYQISHTRNDPYWKFITHMHQEGMMDNPYLPKVYKHTVVKDQNDNSKNTATIEKLQPIQSATPADRFHIFHRVFGEEFSNSELGKRYLSNPRLSGDNYDDERASMAALNFVFGTIERVIIGQEDTTSVDDPDLIDAIKFIAKVKQKYNATSDLHAENFMLRRGPTGVQLVILDPLFIPE